MTDTEKRGFQTSPSMAQNWDVMLPAPTTPQLQRQAAELTRSVFTTYSPCSRPAVPQSAGRKQCKAAVSKQRDTPVCSCSTGSQAQEYSGA